jgi:hypothetical protein
MTLGTPHRHYRSTDSTNTRARELAAVGAPHGTIVTAAEQTSGRGRQGRTWTAPPDKALLYSAIVRPLEERHMMLPLAVPLAVCDAAEQLNPDLECKVKWPNDIHVEGRKLAGVLIEARPQDGWAVLGIGLNLFIQLEEFPPDLRDTAISVFGDCGEGRGKGSAGPSPLLSAGPLPSAPPLLRIGWAVLAIAFIGGAVYSSFLALRDAPVGPPGHGAELRSFLPKLHGQPVLYAGQDRFAAYELMGADTHVPLVEFPDDAVSPNPEKPFDTGDAYSPIDFDSFSRGTLDRFPFVITSRAAWNSQAPPNFKRVATTDSYVLWERTGLTPEDRHVLLEGTEAGALAGCDAPEIRILLSNPGRAGLFPDAVIGHKDDWRESSILETNAETSQSLRLPAGSWNLSLQYFSPFDLTLSAPGFSEELGAALDGQRPNTISLGNNGQYWPAGRYESSGGPVRFTVETEEASTLQSLTGYDGKAYLGELVAVPAEPHRTVPLRAACDQWIDWYESAETP